MHTSRKSITRTRSSPRCKHALLLKYFKLAKPTDDHLPDPEGTLSSKLLSSAIASANSEVCSVIDSNRHLPFFNTCIYSLFGTAPPHAAFKCKSYYPSCGEICQTFFLAFFRQIEFFADSPNFNPSKLLSFTVFV